MVPGGCELVGDTVQPTTDSITTPYARRLYSFQSIFKGKKVEYAGMQVTFFKDALKISEKL